MRVKKVLFTAILWALRAVIQRSPLGAADQAAPLISNLILSSKCTRIGEAVSCRATLCLLAGTNYPTLKGKNVCVSVCMSMCVNAWCVLVFSYGSKNGRNILKQLNTKL